MTYTDKRQDSRSVVFGKLVEFRANGKLKIFCIDNNRCFIEFIC